jgi:imidazolonepropionase-like amidohydrolase
MLVRFTVACVLTAVYVSQSALADDATAFVNANVIPMTSGEVLTGQTLVVRGGRISAIGPDADITGIEDVIDADGRFLLPGLVEMHAHVPPPEQQAYLQDVLWLWLANGVTTVRGVLGHDSHLRLRDDLEQHRLPGPRLYASGPSLRGTTVSNPEHARSLVREQHRSGYDHLKLHPGLTREEFDAIADEARNVGIDFVGHVSQDVGLLRSLDGGQRTIEHLDGYVQALVPGLDAHEQAAEAFFGVDLMPHVDRNRIAELVRATRDAGASVVPTQTLFINVATPLGELDARPENVYLPSALLSGYRQAVARIGDNPHLPELIDLRNALIKALHDGGVPVLLGSDSPQIFNVPGFAIHRELEAMVHAGLTPFEALQTGTVNPARYFDNNAGTLEVGRDADIVMLRANPLEDIRNSREVDGVMRLGHWYDPERRRQALAEIAERYQANGND